MKTNSTSKINFNAIKLSQFDYFSARNIAMSLKFQDVDVLGKKQLVCSNDFQAKQKTFAYVRQHSDFQYNQCGFIFLPWSRECWIVGDKSYEQKLYPKIRNMDKKAVINILL